MARSASEGRNTDRLSIADIVDILELHSSGSRCGASRINDFGSRALVDTRQPFQVIGERHRTKIRQDQVSQIIKVLRGIKSARSPLCTLCPALTAAEHLESPSVGFEKQRPDILCSRTRSPDEI